MTDTDLTREALESYHNMIAVRDRIDAGELSWEAYADFFTEDAVFIDPAWGRIEGRENIRSFIPEAMAGLTETGWYTPEHWVMADGCRVVSRWDQVMGKKADGSEWSVPGYSELYYAGDGLFCYELDTINMAHFADVVKAMQWQPPEAMNFPPKEVDRNTALPSNWAHLAKR